MPRVRDALAHEDWSDDRRRDAVEDILTSLGITDASRVAAPRRGPRPKGISVDRQFDDCDVKFALGIAGNL